VVQLEDWKDVLRINPSLFLPKHAVWYVIARDRAKLGAKWRPAFFQRKSEEFLRCPKCHARLVKDTGDDKAKAKDVDQDGLNLAEKDLAKKRLNCQNPQGKHKVCGEPLWQYSGELRRWEPAKYIHKRLKGFFD